ncbi:amino acid adenylation domain-containing protein [Lentzea sp. NPDC060358]|uniref:non-ribosomal peptide synthetase n=1 Tax=Lentzea sp. NPDC060358 TaxID=3347103 RepID=UPI0036510AAE
MGDPTPRTGGLTPERQRLLEKLLAESNVPRRDEGVTRRGGDRSTAPLSFGQERLYLVEQGVPGSTMFVGTGAVRLRGDLDVEVLRRSFAVLVERHEALRTAIAESPETGEPVQLIRPGAEVPVGLPVRDVDGDGLRAAVALAAAEPFDLTRPPLLRPVLLRVTDAPAPEWVLVLSMHHIAVDAWSIGVLMREFGEVYRALSAGQPPQLPELPIGYGDFAAWQRDRLAHGELDEQAAHWRDLLAGTPLVDVPVDRPRPANRDYSGGTVPLAVRPDVVGALRALTGSAGTTLFTALAAAWSLVLGRWSGGDDVVVGTPVAGRRRSELENVVGFFVNTLPLRLGADPAQDFRTAVARAHEVCADAFAHQDVPFDRIVGESALERDVSGQTALARHWLALNNNAWKASWPGVDAEVLPDLVGTVRCDLSVQLAPALDGGLDGHLEFSAELFDEGTAQRIAAAFTDLLTAAAAAPDSTVAELFAEAERPGLAALPGAVAPVESGHPDVVRWFEAQADATPDAVAVVADEPHTEVRYAELDRRADRVAHLLTGRGVRPGDLVGLRLDRGPALVAAVLGVWKAGAVYLPLVADLPPRRLEQVLGIARPAVVLEEADLVLPEQEGDPAPRLAVPLAPDAPAYLLFTSGSTGVPKGVLATHGGLLNRLAGMQDSYRLTGNDRVLGKASTGFDVSLWELFLPLVTGAAVVLTRPDGHRDVAYLHEVVAARRVTICHFVPSLLEEFARAEGPAAPALRLLLSGGERLTRQLAERVLARWPEVRFVNQYGPTETVIDVTAGDVTAPVPDVVPIGAPVPGTELLVLDAAGAPVPVGVPGELHVGGVQVALGYVGAPEETARRFVPHPARPGERLYATGDRVRWLPGGTLDFLGRSDDQVKVRGHRIEPGEVESVLREHPAVTGALVRVHTGDSGHALLVAHVVAEGEPDDLGAFLADRLPAAAVPDHVVVLDRWPVNTNGKVDVAALPDPLAAQDPGAGYEPPQGEVEQRLAEIWAELLKVDEVGRTTSFASLGGHSLIAIRAVGRIRKTFGARIKIGEFFAAADLASLAVLVRDRAQDSGTDPDDDAPIPRLDRG